MSTQTVDNRKYRKCVATKTGLKYLKAKINIHVK